MLFSWCVGQLGSKRDQMWHTSSSLMCLDVAGWIYWNLNATLAPGRALHLLKFGWWPSDPSCWSFLSSCMLRWQISYSHVASETSALTAAGMRSCEASCSCIITPCVQALWVSAIWNIGVCAGAKSTDFWWLTAWATEPVASLLTHSARKIPTGVYKIADSYGNYGVIVPVRP